jgi:hypothetical protein
MSPSAGADRSAVVGSGSVLRALAVGPAQRVADRIEEVCGIAAERWKAIIGAAEIVDRTPRPADVAE